MLRACGQEPRPTSPSLSIRSTTANGAGGRWTATTAARPASTSARAWRRRPSRTPPATTRLVADYLDRQHARRSAIRSRELLALHYRKRLDLRYGENPHQRAAFYVATDAQARAASARRRSCRARNSRSTTSPMPTPRSNACGSSTTPACVIVKHANPCGVAVATNLARSLRPRLSHRPDLRVRRHHRLQPPARRARRPRPIVERQFVEVIMAPAVDAARARGLAAQGQGAAPGHGQHGREQLGGSRCAASTAACWCRPRPGMVSAARSAGSSRSARPPRPNWRDLMFAWRSAST